MSTDPTAANQGAMQVVVTRRRLLQSLGALGLGTWGFQRALVAQVAEQQALTPTMIAQAEWIAGIELSDEEREEVAESVGQTLASARRLREVPIDADTVPALVFRPDFFFRSTTGETPGGDQGLHVAWSVDPNPQKLSDDELAFAPILTQAALLASRKISSRELTELYLSRLKRYDPVLKCVVTMLEDPALQQARASDQRRRRGGKVLGVLDGIPWVAKDLIAVPPHTTTWGAEPFRDQVRPQLATVAERLNAAGAVLLAKVTLGALAWGDQWFGGMTRNPWNPEQGSSGSSAGSAAAVAAGLASFALGSETLGSIVSPTRRCRTCGLRPTFGRISRAGCMPLAWSMDKIGPIARHVDDMALIFPVLIGQDGKDPTLVERGFRWPIDRPPKSLRVGVTGDRLNATEQRAVAYLESQGAKLVELDLTSELPVSAMNFILGVEATTVFDDVFRQDSQADYGLWSSTFRQAQFTPAVQYLRAQRLRGQLVSAAEEKLAKVDVVLGADDLLLTNLTGHPSLIVACGSEDSRSGPIPGVVKLTAAAYREEMLLHVGRLLQTGLPPKPTRPPLDEHL